MFILIFNFTFPKNLLTPKKQPGTRWKPRAGRRAQLCSRFSLSNSTSSTRWSAVWRRRCSRFQKKTYFLLPPPWLVPKKTMSQPDMLFQKILHLIKRAPDRPFSLRYWTLGVPEKKTPQKNTSCYCLALAELRERAVGRLHLLEDQTGGGGQQEPQSWGSSTHPCPSPEKVFRKKHSFCIPNFFKRYTPT